jgi:hypothetical protein
MKKLLWVAVLALIGWTSAPAQVELSFGLFYSSLSPHGEWIGMDGGTYAWRPVGVEAGWRPYNNGHWVWTDDGWYWASDEPWGWATYHYGRWYSDEYYGWVWVPGYEWAPAWVEWRYGGNYFGWAPLSPYAVFSVGWGIYYQRYWSTPYYYWSFCDYHYICSPNVGHYVYRTEENTRYIGQTRTAGSVRYDNGRIVTRGPERDYVERRGNIRVERADLVDVRDRGQTGILRDGDRSRIEVYRPRIESSGRDGGAPRPDRIRSEERKIGLDTRGTDLRHAEESRQLQDAIRPGSAERRASPTRVPNVTRPAPADRGGERPVVRPDHTTRAPDISLSRPNRPSGQPERVMPAPRPDRDWFRTPRSVAPERGVTRPPASRGEPSRGGGGSKGERTGRR